MSAAVGSTFTRKAIDITFQLGTGTFGDTGSNTVTVSGLRVVATITKVGGVASDQAYVRVYGLSPTIQGQLSSIGTPAYYMRNNVMAISPGDANGTSLAYQGLMYSAYQNFEHQPDTFLEVSCNTSWAGQLVPTAPLSVRGTGDVATMFQSIAQSQNLSFENNGVQVKLSNPYFAGTQKEQCDELAAAANVVWTSDGATLAIWPVGGSRGTAIPLISPETGMIGYPTRVGDQGIGFRTYYNPNIVFGGQIQMQSSYTQANGQWYVNRIVHDLTSQQHGGPWQTECECWRLPTGTSAGA